MTLRKKNARIGMFGYARVLGAIAKNPQTRLQLIADGVVGKTACRRLVCAFLYYRLVHVSGWSRPNIRSMALPVFAFGPGEDAPPPRERAAHIPRACPPAAGSDLEAFFALVAMLREGPMSKADVTARMGISERTVRRCILELVAQGLARIADWESRADMRGQQVPAYAFGPGPSKPRPAPKSRVAARKDYFRRHKSVSARTAAHLTVSFARPMAA